MVRKKRLPTGDAGIGRRSVQNKAMEIIIAIVIFGLLFRWAIGGMNGKLDREDEERGNAMANEVDKYNADEPHGM